MSNFMNYICLFQLDSGDDVINFFALLQNSFSIVSCQILLLFDHR